MVSEQDTHNWLVFLSGFTSTLESTNTLINEEEYRQVVNISSFIIQEADKMQVYAYVNQSGHMQKYVYGYEFTRSKCHFPSSSRGEALASSDVYGYTR